MLRWEDINIDSSRNNDEWTHSNSHIFKHIRRIIQELYGNDQMHYAPVAEYQYRQQQQQPRGFSIRVWNIPSISNDNLVYTLSQKYELVHFLKGDRNLNEAYIMLSSNESNRMWSYLLSCGLHVEHCPFPLELVEQLHFEYYNSY